MKPKVLMGVGNEIDGDDGAGPYAARYAERIKPGGWRVINAENVPENYTSVIRRIAPKLLVMVDAADMGLKPGEIRIIPKERIGLLTISTHSIPLSLFMEFLEESVDKVVLVGIQINPENLYLGAEMGEYMKKGAERAVDMIFRGELEKIEEYR